jgi:hypothetical protein
MTVKDVRRKRSAFFSVLWEFSVTEFATNTPLLSTLLSGMFKSNQHIAIRSQSRLWRLGIRRGMMHWLKWKTKIDSAIAEMCIQIIKEPLCYFSEADVQQLLVEELHKIKPFYKLYPTSVLKGKDSKGAYSTTLVHREYGGGDRTRIDIVVFDPDDVQKINNVNLTVGKKYLKSAYAFELGTEKTSDTSAHLKSDRNKLKKRTKREGTGYLIHFYKDVTQARTGTKSREKTEEKIEEAFKKVFDTKQTMDIENVKILAILLRTYRNQKKMRGKCEIFNGEKWVKTNISRDDELRSAILKQLA